MFKNKRIVLYDTLFPAAPPAPRPDTTEEHAEAKDDQAAEPAPAPTPSPAVGSLMNVFACHLLT